MQINISNIDKVQLLRALWENMKPSRFNMMRGIAIQFNEREAENAISGYVDYFCGRCIKIDFSEDIVDPRLYERDAGIGKFQQIVDSLNPH